MIFTPTYQASNEANQYTIASSTVNFSNNDDVVEVNINPDQIRGLYMLMHDGNDQYYGTDFDSPNWDNIANGNRGNDFLEGSNASRDYLRGGKDNDKINGNLGGNDMLLGDAGDDWIVGSKTGNNILRGGKGNDSIFGGNMRDLIIGDLGKDEIMGNGGSDLFLLRTDTNNPHFGDPESRYEPIQGQGGLNNISTYAMDVDRIVDFGVDDFLVIPGVESPWLVSFIWHNGGDYLIQAESPNGPLYIGILDDPGFLPSHNQLVLDDRANDIWSSASDDSPAFTNDSNLLNTFGI